jgi:hypothetical protein
MEAETVVFERSPMSFAHQEVDQTFIGIRHLLTALAETDSGRIDNRKVISHKSIQHHRAGATAINPQLIALVAHS